MTSNNFLQYIAHCPADELWQIVCTDVGMNRVPPGSPYPPNRAAHPIGFQTVATGRQISEYQLVYIPTGQGNLEMNGQHFQLSPGSLFILFPDIKHAYCPDPTTGWVEYWVGCTGSQLDYLVTSGIISPAAPLFHPGSQASLLSSLQTIFELVQQRQPFYQLRVCAEILRILAETLSLEQLAVQQTKSQEIIEQAKAFIGANLKTGFDLATLGSALHIPIHKMNHIFKSHTGMTPYQYCINIRINRAKEILASGESSVKEIAWQLGFDDPFYFSRLFKKKTGFYPTQWMQKQVPA